MIPKYLSTVTKRDYAAQLGHRAVLIDGSMLAKLMMDCDPGVSAKEVYTGSAWTQIILKKSKQ